MRILDGLVDHRHDNVAAALIFLPRVEQVDVGARLSDKHLITRIVVMPLRRQERIVECPFNRIGRLGVSFDILPDPGLVFIHRRRLLGNQNSDIFTKFIHLIDISAHPAVFDCGPNQKRDRRNR